MHTRVAGSGYHLPSAAHTALILSAGMITSEDYLSSRSCALICLNRNISRDKWLPTSDWNSNVQNSMLHEKFTLGLAKVKGDTIMYSRGVELKLLNDVLLDQIMDL